MPSAKDELRRFIDGLNEEDAIRTIGFVRQLIGFSDGNGVLELLAANPAVRITSATGGRLEPFHPIGGTGVTASRLLIEDRR